MSSATCAWCLAPLGPGACMGCGRATLRGLRPGLWVLDRYRLESSLGDTGVALCWIGVDEAGHEVFVSALHEAVLEGPRRRERFADAMLSLRSFSHPYAQPVLDLGVLPDQTITLVEAWRPGRTLAASMAAGPMHPSDASRVIEQVALALGALHKRGLAHGDVKPEGVHCAGDGAYPGDAWLLSAGLISALVGARAVEANALVLGSPAYMAPERFSGRAPDARSDLYELGLVAYELFEGRGPFEASTPWEWAMYHLTRAPRPWSATAGHLAAPPRMRAAVSRCLEKDPTARFATAEAFLAAAREPADDLFGPVPFGPDGGVGPYRGRG
jgi:serine/threonine protein kinase